jgi:hypothetical protein
MPDYTWVTNAPIQHVPPDQVDARVRRFCELLDHWGEVGGGTALAARMNHHANRAVFIAGLAGSEDNQAPWRPVFEYRLAGEPIAIMMLDLRREAIEIKFLATHPGSENAGGIMVEFALNRAKFYNNQGAHYEDGVVGLESLDGQSTAAYSALGFEPAGGRDMALDARESDLWIEIDGVWKLRRYQAARYLSVA